MQIKLNAGEIDIARLFYSAIPRLRSHIKT